MKGEADGLRELLGPEKMKRLADGTLFGGPGGGTYATGGGATSPGGQHHAHLRQEHGPGFGRRRGCRGHEGRRRGRGRHGGVRRSARAVPCRASCSCRRGSWLWTHRRPF
ncbi:unnamed protein product [Prorocentrum cordatum]|uniref:Uncharacterized protein n=1 Tax=Prorocentrum cordatum TaxID=2364126 RepID=A0ABN9WR13_9DINO|nr:unnamed protein product [Polarella glacialis]